MFLARLRVLVFPESVRWWTARSLEHDIAASAPTAEAALDSLVKIAQAHVAYDIRHGREPLSVFAPAPRPYWSAFPAGIRSGLHIELHRPDAGPAIHVITARLGHHPVVAAYRSSRDPVVAALEREADPVLGSAHHRGDGVVGEDVGHAGRYRRSISGARM